MRQKANERKLHSHYLFFSQRQPINARKSFGFAIKIIKKSSWNLFLLFWFCSFFHFGGDLNKLTINRTKDVLMNMSVDNDDDVDGDMIMIMMVKILTIAVIMIIVVMMKGKCPLNGGGGGSPISY